MSKILKNNNSPTLDNKQYNDQDILNDILLSYKHLVSSYGIALNEASNKNIYDVYFNIMRSTSKIQANLFQLSFKKGWYELETAEGKKINKSFTKFNNYLNQIKNTMKK